MSEPAPSQSASVRTWLLLVGLGLVFATVASFILFVLPTASDPNAPKFIALNVPATNSFLEENYQWGEFIPVRDGRTWTGVDVGPKDYREYLYDLKTRRIVGEATNCGPLFFNQDGSKLFCEGYHPTLQTRVAEKVSGWLSKIHLRRTQLYHESFYIVDTHTGKSTFVGEFPQETGYGSIWVPSPNFRYGYNRPTAHYWLDGLFICDLERDTFKKVDCPNETHGWWDAENIVLLRRTNNFLLYNVTTGTTTNLFTSEQIKQFLKQNNLPQCELTTLAKWNGTATETYFAPMKERNWGKGFLLKVDRGNRTLKILDRDFQFRWTGRISPDDRYYLYSGESGQPGRGGDGSVNLRDMHDNSVHVLVPPNNSGQYSLCSFFDGGVIYIRNRHLWRIDLNGSNNVALFTTNNVH